MAEDAVNVKFGASIEELLSKLGTSGSAVQNTVGGMKASLDLLQGVFSKISAGLIAITAAVAGGVSIKQFIDKTNELNAEASKLARTLGITGAEAGILAVAIGDVGAEVDTYTGAFRLFARQLKNNEDGLKKLGLQTRDSNGTLREAKTLFGEALQVVGQYKQGFDQATVSQMLFGRGAGDVSKLQKLNNEVMEEARQKVRDLGLTITKEGLKASLDYKRAMNDVGDVTTAVQKVLGDTFIAGFTRMANKFAEYGPAIVNTVKAIAEAFVSTKELLADTFGSLFTLVGEILSNIAASLKAVFGTGGSGPTAFEVFKNVLSIVGVSFITLRVVIDEAVNFIRTLIQALGSAFVSWAEIVERALKGDFKGAAAAWKQQFVTFARTIQDGMNEGVRIAIKGAKDIDAAISGNVGKAGTPAGEVGKSGPKQAPLKIKDGEAKARVALQQAEAQAELAALKEALKEMQEASDDAYKNNLLSIKQYYADKLAIETVGIKASIDEKKREIEAIDKERAPKNETERLQIAAQRAKVYGELVVLEEQLTNAVVKNGRERVNAEREQYTKLQEIAATGRKALAEANLNIEEGEIKQQFALRKIDEQDELAQLRALSAKKLEIERAFIAEKRALANGSPAVLQQLLEEEDRAYEAHAARVKAITNDMELERVKMAQQATDSIQSSFQSFIETVASGTTSIKKALLSLVNSISAAISKLAAEMIAKNLFGSVSGGGQGFGGIISSLLGSVFGGGAAAGASAGGGNVAQGLTFGGGFAEGGNVYPSQAYVVGEKGPEMFVPRSAGTIVPNGAGGGTSVTNNFSISGPADMRTQQQVAAMAGIGVSRAMQRNR